MSLTLRERILAWSIGSTVVIVLAVLFLADSFFRTTIRTTLEENLRSGARLAAELRESEVGDWIAEVARMALDPTLRASVATGDPATISASLEQYLANSEADWLAVVTPEGELLAEVGPVPVENISNAATVLNETVYYDSGDTWRVGTELVDVGATSLYFGELRLGVLIGGRRVDAESARELGTFIGQRVAFLAGDGLAAADSSLSAAAAADLLRVSWGAGSNGLAPGGGTGGLQAVRGFSMAGEDFLGVEVPLIGAAIERVGSLVVFRSLDAALQPAQDLRLALLGLGAGGLFLGLLFSFALARSVTRPLGELLVETVRIGSGNLEEPVQATREDEIGQLARGFEHMRTSLREAREELVRRERLSAVGRAASALVHDFSQPVTVISAHTELLAQGSSDEKEREEDVAAIMAEVGRLKGMMREILEFARGEVNIERTPGSVSALLDDVARQSRPVVEREGLILKVDHEYTGEWVLDHPRTARALGNLVRNAAAALRSGGTVSLRSSQRNGSLVLEVADDGPGIPEEIHATLFEPFVTRGKREGTGLGLAIVKNIAESQGGAVSFRTSARGTVFSLEFPETSPPDQ